MGNNNVKTEMKIELIWTETTEKFWDAETEHNKTADTKGTEHVKNFFSEAWLQANNIHNVRTAYAKHVGKKPNEIRQLPAYIREELGLVVEDGENDKKLTNRGLKLLENCIADGKQTVEDTELYKYVDFRQSQNKRMADRFSQLVNQYDVHLSKLAKERAEAEAQKAKAEAEANGETETETETETENSIIPIDNRIEATLKFLKDYSDDDIVKFLHTIANEHRTILKADLAKAQAEAEAEQKKLQEKAEADKKAKAEAEKKFRKETAKQIQNPKNRKKPYVARDQKNTKGLQASA